MRPRTTDSERLGACLLQLAVAAGRPAMVMHLYQVVGRHLPVEKKDGSVDNNTKIYRMKVFAEDEVRACALFFSQPPPGGAPAASAGRAGRGIRCGTPTLPDSWSRFPPRYRQPVGWTSLGQSCTNRRTAHASLQPNLNSWF